VQKQKQTQIPFGNDKQSGTSKGKSKSKGKDKGKIESNGSLYDLYFDTVLTNLI